MVGRLDPEIRQLENAILAEKRTDRLRIVSADSLLSLAEMTNVYDINYEDILPVIRPSSPTVDPIVDLMERLVASKGEPEPPIQPPPPVPLTELPKEGNAFWLTPVRSDDVETAEDVIANLVGKEHIYAFGERTPGRKRLNIGDWICFYATGKGIIAHAKVASKPEYKLHPKVRHPEKYPWVFKVENVSLYLDSPVAADAETRSHLEAFRGRELNTSWAWFVRATHTLSANDFRILTRSAWKLE